MDKYGQRYAARTPDDARHTSRGVDARQSSKAVLPLPPGPPPRASQKASGVKRSGSENPSSSPGSGVSSQSERKRKSNDVSHGERGVRWKGSSSPAGQQTQQRGEALDERSSGHESSRASSARTSASPEHAPRRLEDRARDSELNATQGRPTKEELEGRAVQTNPNFVHPAKRRVHGGTAQSGASSVVLKATCAA